MYMLSKNAKLMPILLTFTVSNDSIISGTVYYPLDYMYKLLQLHSQSM